MLVFDTEWKSGIYDMNGKKEVSKVLRCFHNDNTVTFDRFPYHNHNQYREATKEDIDRYQCTYYLEDGTRPHKTKSCSECEGKKECNHNQKYYERCNQ